MLSCILNALLWTLVVASEPDACEDDGCRSSVSLLQSQLDMTYADTETVNATDSDFNRDHRVAWFHVPKCGTSFGTTLIHYANRSVPSFARMHSMQELEGTGLAPGTALQAEFPIDKWFKGLLWEKGGNWGNHNAVTPQVYEEFKGSFFGMFREPWRRMYSEWNHFAKDKGTPPADFIEKRSATATKMLSGQQHGMATSRDVWPPDLDTALARLDGFAFVGLTDHWNLSICLFHAMFGGDLVPSELINTRPGNYAHASAEEDEFRQKGDWYDDQLFKKADHIFWSNVAQHKAALSTCPHMDEDARAL